MKVNLSRRVFSHPLSLLCLVATAALGGGMLVAEPEEGAEKKASNLPTTVEEARGRARWLHEVVHGALQVMHRDFFDEDSVERSLPSQSLDDVFAEMSRTYRVEIRWLGVNATKGKNHLPKDRFEEQAAEALRSGKMEYEQVDGKRFRFAGHIRLQNECLKCHVPDRRSLEDRVAGLAISFPMAPAAE